MKDSEKKKGRIDSWKEVRIERKVARKKDSRRKERRDE